MGWILTPVLTKFSVLPDPPRCQHATQHHVLPSVSPRITSQNESFLPEEVLVRDLVTMRLKVTTLLFLVCPLKIVHSSEN